MGQSKGDTMQFSASRAFTDAFQLLGARFGMLTGIWLLFFAAIIGLLAVFGGMFFALIRQTAGGGSPLAGMSGSLILFYLLYLLMLFAQQIALSRASTGRAEDTFSVALGSGLRGALPMLGVLLIYVVVGTGAGLVVSLILAGIVAGTQSPAIAVVLTLLILIAAFYLFARLSLVLPLVAIEEVRNPLTAIAKAWKLTAHKSIKIALTWGLVLIAVFVLYGIGLMVTIGLPAPGNVPGPTGSIAFLILMLVMGLSAGLYMVTLTTALYEQLAPSSAELTAATFE